MASHTDADDPPAGSEPARLPFSGTSRSGRLVAIELPAGSPTADALCAIWERGDTPLPLPASWPHGRRRAVVRALRPTSIVTGDGETSLPGPEPVDGDVALVVTTSGSTGRPKAVALTVEGLSHAVSASVRRLGCASGERWLCCLPLHHVAGVSVLLRSELLDAPAVVHGSFDVAAVVGEDGASHVSLVPTMLHRMLEAGADVGRFRTILLGGAPPRTTLLDRARGVGAGVVESYGMTETCGGCVYDGRPLDGVDVELVDDPLAPRGAGRVTVAGPVVMRGYLRDGGLTDDVLRDGRLVTNDLGRWDDDGRLAILGRTDDVIVTGGENVAAAEVVAVLREHPGVADAAVGGRPDDEWGEIVVAHCIAADPGDPPTLDDLRGFVTERAPVAHAPRELVLVDRLPGDEADRTFVS